MSTSRRGPPGRRGIGSKLASASRRRDPPDGIGLGSSLRLLAAAGIGGGTAYWLWTAGYESTDDAFIAGHVVPVSSRVAGHVAKVS